MKYRMNTCKIIKLREGEVIARNNIGIKLKKSMPICCLEYSNHLQIEILNYY